jgi:hypothetical protein
MNWIAPKPDEMEPNSTQLSGIPLSVKQPLHGSGRIGKSLVAWLLVALMVGPVVSAAKVESPAATWQIETVDSDGCWYPSLALNGAGLPRISYGAQGELKFAWYDGADWHTEFVEEQPGSTGWYSSLALDSLDNPHISYYSPYSDSLMYAQYYSDSWHIETVGSTYDGGGQTSLALDSADLPHIVYWDYTHLKVGYAFHDGADWHFDTVTTMTAGGQSVSLALALDSADHPHMCYYDYEADALKYAHHDGANWQFELVDDDVFYNGQNCSIVLDAQDRPRISYRDLALYYAYRDGAQWRIDLVDDDFFAGDGNSLALDGAGHPHISYTDWAFPDEELRYAYFSGLHWWIEIVDVAAETRRFEEASLALDNSGQPHIGYWDLGSSDVLKYAVRGGSPTFNLIYLPLLTRDK